jgi:hypothetical protein
MYEKYHVDMLQCVSLSGCASRIRYTFPYENFDINGNYAKNTTTKYTLTEKEFKHNCLSYKQQDVAKKRDTTHNIIEVDYMVVKSIVENSVCHMCGEGFDLSNKPTLDRIDNNKGHSLDNIKPYYLICNRYKSNKDESVRKLVIKLRQFARENNLPATLFKGQEKLYKFLRKGVRNTPSNVHNRFNFQGDTKIKKLWYDKDSKEIKVFETLNCEGKHTL